MTHILLVEDNADLAFGLRNNLEIEGYQVEVATNGQEALEALSAAEPDLVILDLMIPKVDGFSVLRHARDSGVQAPVLILTARGEELDKVHGLRLGADDYVTKPFSLLELLARVEALLRRTKTTESISEYRFGDIEVRVRSREVLRSGRTVEMTPKEYDLLLALLHRHGAIAERADLMQEVWGYREGIHSRTLDTHVAELRRKLEPSPAAPAYILTVRTVGYRLETRESGRHSSP